MYSQILYYTVGAMIWGDSSWCCWISPFW